MIFDHNTVMMLSPNKEKYYKRAPSREPVIGWIRRRAYHTTVCDCGAEIKTAIQCPKHGSQQYLKPHSFQCPASLRFPGFCWGLPKTKTVLVSKTQNQLPLHHGKADEMTDISNLIQTLFYYKLTKTHEKERNLNR